MYNQKPLVSVLVPAYNHDKYVEEAILSVINQTYGYNNIQLIVADDYSQDNTAEVISKLSGKYKFKFIKHTKNTGACATLNEMISISSGKYITSFASDDIMVPDRIENQIKIISENPGIDILAGDIILIDKLSKIIYIQSSNNPAHLMTYDFEDLFLRLKPGFAAGATIIKSDLYKRIGAYDPNYKIEDYFFWLKAAYNKAKIVKCNIPFLYYRVLSNSLSSDKKMMDQEGFKVLTIYKSHPKYDIAIQNREIFNLSKMIFIDRIKVLQNLTNNPVLLLNRRIIKLLIMLFLPKSILRRKFPENFYRYEKL